MDNWENIWSNKKDLIGEITMEKLLLADGFNCGAGKVEAEDWTNFLEQISEEIGISEGDSIFEVGCGSGAFLYYFYKRGHTVAGLDYSPPLVQLAKSAMSDMDFVVGSADNLETLTNFCHVVSFGVFHYFPDLNYAERVIAKMLVKATKTVAVMDLPDITLRAESENARKSYLKEGEYERLYKSLTHLYYNRDWFKGLTDKYGIKIEIFNQKIKNYGNNRFRFNVVMKK